MAVVTKSRDFCNIMKSSPCFGGTQWLRLQGGIGRALRDREVLMAVVTKSKVFWNITQRTPCFGGT
jgi:hypothetical protein